MVLSKRKCLLNKSSKPGSNCENKSALAGVERPCQNAGFSQCWCFCTNNVKHKSWQQGFILRKGEKIRVCVNIYIFLHKYFGNMRSKGMVSGLWGRKRMRGPRDRERGRARHTRTITRRPKKRGREFSAKPGLSHCFWVFAINTFFFSPSKLVTRKISCLPAPCSPWQYLSKR